MFASKSRFFVYPLIALTLLLFSSALKADAKTITIGEVTDTVSIPGTLINSGVGGSGSQYWALNGSNLYASSTSYNVGIGTTAPTAGLKLHVLGNFTTSGVVSFTGSTFINGGNRVLTVDNSGVLGAAAIPQDIYWTGTATNLNATTGRTSLGLGSIATLNAISSFNITDGTIVNADISNSAAIAATKLENGTFFINSAGTNGQVWTSDGVGAGYWNTSSSGSITGLGTANYLTKWTDTTAIGNSLLYDNGTKIGIGLTNPGSKLDVQGPGYGLPMTSGNVQTYGVLRLSEPTGSGNVVLDMGINGSLGAWIQATLKTNHAANYPLLLNPNGSNVGVGTTNAGAKLDVNGAVRSTSATISLLSGTGSRMVTADASGTLGVAAIPGLPAGSSGQTLRHNGTSWVSTSNLYNNGTNIGMGTTAPGTHRLYVSGTAYFSSTLTAVTSVTSNAFIYSSDRNLKTNIETIPNALEKVRALRGVTFNWKKDDRHSVGLIAQEVQQVFPQLVSESNGSLAVEYGNLVAPLIEAVKEQQLQIETLERRISDLENK